MLNQRLISMLLLSGSEKSIKINDLHDFSYWVGINMICIKTEIPQEICDIDDELKAIYHSKDTVCIWVFETRIDRNRFMDETTGMLKNDREMHFESFYKVR